MVDFKTKYFAHSEKAVLLLCFELQQSTTQHTSKQVPLLLSITIYSTWGISKQNASLTLRMQYFNNNILS